MAPRRTSPAWGLPTRWLRNPEFGHCSCGGRSACTQEADAVEAAVEGILDEGYRTKEIAMPGDETLNTRQMGNLIASRIN